MRASICVGEYATTPYYVLGLELPVYCMEELCYCLKENAFLLDVSLMNDALMEWIGDGCGLGVLARELYPLVHKQGSLSAFVCMILEYVGLYDTTAIHEVEQVLKQGAGLSNIEKRKSQIDYLVKKKKYDMALRGYDALLSKWQQLEREGQGMPAARVRAAILHNKGVAFTGLMLYGQAADAFWLAQETYNSESHFMAFLAAKRMELSEEEYIAFAAEMANSYDMTLALEKQIESLQGEWQEHEDYQRLQLRNEWKEGSSKQKYYEESERWTLGLKNSYRNSVLE
ncbi:MAG: hypothetical protein E7291_04775 [Lachnospiraceae bacterium]|nr:hypothetical protein [Lachnospiraceae bacterium]